MLHEIRVPRSLTSVSAVSFVQQVMSSPDADDYVFDFSALHWFEPFAMIFVGEGIKRFCQEKMARGSRCSVRNHRDHSYAGHMGFFQSFGLDYGNRPGDAAGGSNYLPINELEIDDLYWEARDTGQKLGEVITDHATSIATVLTRTGHGILHETVSYAIREVLRNAAEHSQSKIVKYCGQYWPSRNRVQIAIMDCGIGIKQSLSRNPYLDMQDDSDALKLAIMPGISGKMYEGVEIRPYDEWQNSGYGLYMLYRMCRAAGSLFMVSNNATLEIISNTHTAIPQPALSGTAIRIQFDTSRLVGLSDQLARYGKEGKGIAKTISGAQKIKASSASLMLHVEEE